MVRALGAIHDLFRQAPLLGSLIEPTGGDLIDPVRIARVEAMLEPVIERARAAEPERAEGAIAARGMADAAALLHRRFSLAITNPPFLGQGEFSNELMSYTTRRHKNSKADLSTVMLERMTSFVHNGGTAAAVTKQEWCFLPTFYKFRQQKLERSSFRFFVFLGEEAWEAFGNRGPKATLLSLDNLSPTLITEHFVIDTTSIPDRNDKARALSSTALNFIKQCDQYKNPKGRISSGEQLRGTPLSDYAFCYNGIVTGDADRFIRKFWEVNTYGNYWIFQQTATEDARIFSGMDRMLRWDNEFHAFIKERLDENPGAWLRGTDAWGKLGIVVSGMRYLNRGMYTGSAFDNNCSILIAKEPENTAALWSFCTTPGYVDLIKLLNPKVSVTDNTFVQVPFDLAHWQEVAAEKYPNGLPEPYSDEPTQWLFHGHPAKVESGKVLHVALARLAGYRWPAETDPDMRLSLEARAWIAKAAILPAADAESLLCLPPVAGERALVDGLRTYLAAAFGAEWSHALERRLVAEADEVLDKRPARDGSLEAWLRERAFRQHCALFHQRPFLWHIWDGQADGFAAFLHYHRLTRANLEKLTFSLLGDWIARVRDAGDSRRLEAALILQEKLQAILKGESPLDIFVRWKPLSAQPIGWNPGLDDGVIPT
jgi:hypothetical protein